MDHVVEHAEAQETPVAPEAAEKPQVNDRISSQFAALARKEKALRAEAQRLKAERDLWAKEKQGPDLSNYISKEDLKTKNISLLLDAGFSLEEIAQRTLEYNERMDPRYSELQNKIDSLSAKTDGWEKKLEEKEKEREENAFKQMLNEAKILVNSDESFEAIKEFGNVNTVVEHIKRTYEEDGVLLSVQDAAKEVEELLVEEISRLAKLEKIKKRMMPGEAPPSSEQQVKPEQQQSLKTLTSQITSASKQPLSEKERVRRAILRAQGLDPSSGKPISS